MRRLLILPLALLGACDIWTTQPPSTSPVYRDPRAWVFQMPMVHDTTPEYLFCADSLHNGDTCEFRDVKGTYEEAGDWSFLDMPDSSVKWPNHDNVGPLYIGRISLPKR